MEKIIAWDSSFLIGIKQVDLEHRTFVELVNELSSVRNDPEMVRRTLAALVKYAAFHFQSEENLMYRIGYPALDEHRKLHQNLTDTFSYRLMEMSTPSANMDEFLGFLKHWYISHTTGEDQKITRYIQADPRLPDRLLEVDYVADIIN